MPIQMSYSGLNFDIVTGMTAVGVAILLFFNWMPLWGARVWNWMGFALLVNIVTIALLSAPTPARLFTNEPANTWILQPPFVWLPAVMLFMALLGHFVIFRRLQVEGTRRKLAQGKKLEAASSGPVLPGQARQLTEQLRD